MIGRNLTVYLPALSGLKLYLKLPGVVLVGPWYISTWLKNSNARTVFKSCSATAMTRLINKKKPTPQSSNAESNNMWGLRCCYFENEDNAMVMTMKRQAMRIDSSSLAQTGWSKKCCNVWWCIVDFRWGRKGGATMRGEAWSDLNALYSEFKACFEIILS